MTISISIRWGRDAEAEREAERLRGERDALVLRLLAERGIVVEEAPAREEEPQS